LGRCKQLFPTFSQTFERFQCESTEEKKRLAQQAAEEEKRVAQQAEAEHEKRRLAAEEAARPCIAADLPRMENLIVSAKNATAPDMSLEQAKEAIEAAIPLKAGLVTSNENIKEQVLFFTVRPKCSTAFYLVANVLGHEDGQLSWFAVWAQNSPKGYAEGRHEEMGRFYDWERTQKITAQFKAAEDDRNRKAAAAQQKATANSTLGDPCAPGLSRSERVRRLGQYGPLRQISEGEYVAGNHTVHYLYGEVLYACH
jgi:hypothetical protein